MTNNKTTALIEAAKEILACPVQSKFKVLEEALAAFEQPGERGAEKRTGAQETGAGRINNTEVREMTVDEVEEYIYSETKRFTETSALLALAKLGTIRVVE